jgi:ribosomal protein S18 acetylase RimI-like enzyme
VSKIKTLDERDWEKLRDARLEALQESPQAFMSSYVCERDYDEKKWRAEFGRGDWIVVVRRGQTIGLLGITRGPRTPQSECYFEYLWVSPGFRGRKYAYKLIRTVNKRLARSGVETVRLWVIEGNRRARELYAGLGFADADRRQPLPDNPERYEELMHISLVKKKAADRRVRPGSAASRVKVRAYMPGVLGGITFVRAPDPFSGKLRHLLGPGSWKR